MNPFGLKTLLKTCVKTLERMRIFALLKSYRKLTQMGVFITPFEICPLAAGKGRNALPVDRPFDRPTVIFLTVEPSVDRPDRPRLDTESRALCLSTGAITYII